MEVNLQFCLMSADLICPVDVILFTGELNADKKVNMKRKCYLPVRKTDFFTFVCVKPLQYVEWSRGRRSSFLVFLEGVSITNFINIELPYAKFGSADICIFKM